jgi:hypothetical protein
MNSATFPIEKSEYSVQRQIAGTVSLAGNSQ